LGALQTEFNSVESKIEKNLSVIIPALNYRAHHAAIPKKMVEVADLPNKIIKAGTNKNRLTGAQTLNDALKKIKSTTLFVPNQTAIALSAEQLKSYPYYVYPYLIIAEKIKGFHDTKFTLKQVEEMVLLIKESGYADTHKSNFIHTLDDRVALIDTELQGFVKNEIGVASALRTFLRFNNHEEDAYQYLESLPECNS
jgi:hypothetical protein